MGYRYGEHHYGEGLYSRWPDYWHDKLCRDGTWDPEVCAPEDWTGAPVEPLSPWSPSGAPGPAWAAAPLPEYPQPPPWRPAARSRP